MTAESTGRSKRQLWQYHDDNIFDIMCYLPRKDLTACEQASRKLHALIARYRQKLAVPRMRVLRRVRIVPELSAFRAMNLVFNGEGALQRY